MKDLRYFEIESDYLTEKDKLIYPNLSFIAENEKCYLLEKPADYLFIDLGLPSGLKWADRNIGATKPEEGGLYFAWGETEGYKITKGELIDGEEDYFHAIITNADDSETTKTFASDYSDYKWYDSTTESITKYIPGDNVTLELEDDACYVIDNTMRMPTIEESNELRYFTTQTWTDNYNGSGIRGIIFTSIINENSIFVPVDELSVIDKTCSTENSFVNWWTSSLSHYVKGARRISIMEGYEEYIDFWSERSKGFHLRAVKE